jgi:hypothetical protein
MAVTTIPSAGLTLGSQVNFRNLIINGDMSIAQRGTSGTGFGPSKTGYQLDRFAFRKSGGDSAVFTIAQDTDVPSGQGFANSMKIICTTALADGSIPSTQWVRIRYRIEGQDLQKIKKGTSSAESLTLSFWVKSPKTGTHIASIYDDDNARLIAKSYSVSSANTWEKKTITFEGDTTGTLTNDNTSAFRIEWHLQSGTEYQSGSLGTTWHTFASTKTSVGQVNIGDNTANNFFLTGVQLEVGTSASDFEFLPHDVNFDRCMRYYFEEGNNAQSFVAGAFNASDSPFRYQFMKPMRTAPSGSIGGSINTDLKLYSAGSDKTLTAVSFAAITTHGARVEISSSGAFTAGQTGHFYLLNNTGKLKFDAEL